MFEKLSGNIFSETKNYYRTDIHSHFIPEIDDGCTSIEEAISLIKKMKKLGYTKLIATPHVMLKKYPNSTKTIKEALFELRAILKVKNIDIELEVAAEYYCDQHFISLLNKKDILSFGENFVLFELPYTTRPSTLEKCIKIMLRDNYKPVLAHPERYRFLTSILDYKDLKKLGLFFQVNLNSLGGYYGKDAQKKALMLSQKGMVDFVGSDIHHKKHMECFENNLNSNYIEIIFRNNKILNDII